MRHGTWRFYAFEGDRDRHRFVLPDPEDPVIQEAFKQGDFKNIFWEIKIN
jgi:hypothetical protein